MQCQMPIVLHAKTAFTRCVAMLGGGRTEAGRARRRAGDGRCNGQSRHLHSTRCVETISRNEVASSSQILAGGTAEYERNHMRKI